MSQSSVTRVPHVTSAAIVAGGLRRLVSASDEEGSPVRPDMNAFPQTSPLWKVNRESLGKQAHLRPYRTLPIAGASAVHSLEIHPGNTPSDSRTAIIGA